MKVLNNGIQCGMKKSFVGTQRTIINVLSNQSGYPTAETSTRHSTLHCTHQ